MHGVAPRTVLGDKWWNAERRAAYKRTENHCLACGVHKSQAEYHKWLESHEQYDIDYLLGRMRYVGAVPLCHFCHNYIHRGRLQALLEQGRVHHAKYVAIIQHGDRVLKLKKPKPYDGEFAEWADWRLVIEYNGQVLEIPPLYKSFDDWQRAMA